MRLESGELLHERYRLVTCLGSHDARQTWLAHDAAEQPFIVKALCFAQTLHWQDLKLFEREGRTLESLDHPCLPHYCDSFWLDLSGNSYFFLVYRYIPGASLAERVQGGERFDAQQVEQIARQVLAILVYLHSQSPPVIHRDLKPGNLIWGEDERVHLVDFGAVQAPVTAGETFTVVGTYGYMPPEQFGGRTVPASDLYGLGATLLFLLSGVSPADLPQDNLRFDSLPVSRPFKSWLQRLNEPSLDRRFPGAAAALRALDERAGAALASTKPPAGGIKLVERTPQKLLITIAGQPNLVRDLPNLAWLGASASLVYMSTLPHPAGGGAVFELAFALIFLLMATRYSWWPLLRRTRIELYREVFVITEGLPGWLSRCRTGQTSQIRFIEKRRETPRRETLPKGSRSEKGQMPPLQWCALQEESRVLTFASGLSDAELDWLVDEIGSWLRA